MFQAWRVQLRQAEQAMAGGQLEEAGRLLADGELRQFLPGMQLSSEVARRIAVRGQQHVARGDSLAGWRDLDTAAALSAEAPSVARLRADLLEHTLEECRAFLEAGDPAAALKRLEGLERRGIGTAESRRLQQAAFHWNAALGHCRRGDFAQAEVEFATAAALRPGLARLDAQRQECRHSLAEHRRLMDNIYAGVEQQTWGQVLAAADKLLELAPENHAAREARRRAWTVLSPAVRNPRAAERGGRASSTRAQGRSPEVDTVLTEQLGPRFLLWVDAVGGFLVCQGTEVAIGQPSPGGQVDVPILADLSRRHATLHRDGEGYVIQPARDARLDGQPVRSASLLTDGNLIELGRGVVLRFRQPHALSTSARLEMISRHRTQPPVDGVLLMAETLVLGPQPHNHLVCRDWPRDVVIYGRGDELYCRVEGAFEVDGTAQRDRARLERNSRVAGEGFSFSLEPL